MAKRRVHLTCAAIAAVLATACASPGSRIDAVPELRPGILAGYLTRESLPDSMALVPAPPAMGSDAFALDEAVARAAATTRGSARWTLAIDDANLAFPRAAGVFECALDAPVSAQDTPRLYVLLRRALADAGLSTYAAKDHYRRARPFMVNQLPTCTLAEETMLREDGSYPSGHNAIGWAWALILAEIAPDRADLVLARGRAFGQSRVICNVHWQSDASEGRTMGAAAAACTRIATSALT